MLRPDGQHRRRLRLALVSLAALLLLLLTANTIVTTRETSPARADVGRILSLPGPDLQVRQDGSGEPALVLLHGFAGSVRWWDRIAPRLARQFRVIRFDLLGHGGSAKPRERELYEYGAQAEQLRLALERLGVRRAVIVGHSMGGLMAGAVAEEAPGLVRGVVLLGTAPHPQYREQGVAESLLTKPVIGPLLARTIPDSRVRRALTDLFADGTPVPDEFMNDYRDMTYSSFINARAEADEFAEEASLEERLADLGLPVLVIFGDEDQRTEARAFDEYRAIPDVELHEFTGFGHTPQWERPLETARLIEHFYRSPPGGRQSRTSP